MTRFHIYAAISLILLPIAAQTKDAHESAPEPIATCLSNPDRMKRPCSDNTAPAADLHWPWRKPAATCYQNSPEGWPLVQLVLSVPDGQPKLHCVYKREQRRM